MKIRKINLRIHTNEMCFLKKVDGSQFVGIFFFYHIFFMYAPRLFEDAWTDLKNSLFV